MEKKAFILIIALVPALACASTANDFTINRQSTYAVPAGSTNVLILDMTLQSDSVQTLKLQSIKINNIGTVQQSDITKLYLYEDGVSPGWNGDERKIFAKSSSPFFDVVIAHGVFSEFLESQRIFVTVDIAADVGNGKTIQPQLALNSLVFANGDIGPTDEAVTGFERTILSGTNAPSVPLAPLAQRGEALSASAIRWYFMDLSNNEFGFKILDQDSREVARKEEANLSYLDETGLLADTEYSGRSVIAFNDRGENLGSVLTIFPAVRTLTSPATEIIEQPASVPVEATTVEEEVVASPSFLETIQTKIADIQRQINEFIKQLDELIKRSSATVFGALQGFLQAFFGK